MAEYDVVIVGSGVAGLTAGLFAARQGLGTLVLEANVPGGHLMSIERIEDFPGFPDGIAGYELCPALQRQAADHGAELQRAEVTEIAAGDRLWSVATDEGSHTAKVVIAAMGSRVQELGVPGEERLRGRGVSHCASCDGPLSSGKSVAVIGGGDSALQEALTLARYADRVVILTAGEKFTGQSSYVKRVLSARNIVVRYRLAIEEVLGDEVVTGVRARELPSGATLQLDFSGVFVYPGLKPNTALLQDILQLTPTGHVPTDASTKTARDGLYAAGDIRQDSAAQAAAAAGDGTTAALAAYRYIKDCFGPSAAGG
jgi:thioredoxin reductase (NADPH)